MRSALKGIAGVEAVELSPYADVYTLRFRRGVEPDEKTVQEVFKGCAYNGRKVVVERDRDAVRVFLTGHRPLPDASRRPASGRVLLGRRLFADKRISATGSVACVTCHKPQLAFTNGQSTAVGLRGRRMRRNVPTLLNVAYRRSLFWDGRTERLEQVGLQALAHPAVIDMRPEQLAERLGAIAEYAEWFRREFGGPPTAEAFAQCLAAYMRSLVSYETPFDHYARGDKGAISDSARRGYLLFRDKANCITCHSGPDFTDGAFRVIGIGWDGQGYRDRGRGQITGRPGDDGKFRVPPLRELKWTAPYMHDGSLKTLAEVVDFYNRGGPKGAKTDLHGPLHLSDQEKSDLIEFLLSLSSPQPPATPLRTAAK